MVTHNQNIQVTFLVNKTYDGVSGLTRYERGLLHTLDQLKTIEINPIEIGTEPFPKWAVNLAAKAGLGLGQFIQNYPVFWPNDTKELVHLPQRTQASLLWQKGPRKVVITVHDIIHYVYREQQYFNVYQHFIHKWFDLFAIKMLKRTDMILASSEFTRQTLIDHAGLSPNRIKVIYLGVDQDHFKPAKIPSSFYQTYHLDRDKDYILHISTEEARKNVSTLIRAFAQVYSQHPNAMLLKIGRPLYPDQRLANLRLVKELGLENVIRFIDDVPDENLPLFYNAAKVTAMPSLAEGFGFPVLESMACGTPVVCSNTASLPELAGKSALLIEPKDVEQLSQAILKLITNLPLSNNLSHTGLQWVKNFTWEITANQTIKAYQQLHESNF